MKDLFNKTKNESNRFNGVNFFNYSGRFGNTFELTGQKEVSTPNNVPEKLLTPNAFYQMSVGQIPDLWNSCLTFAYSIANAERKNIVSRLIQVMQSVATPKQNEIKRFLRNPETSHVLIDNVAFKLKLIHWQAGKVSAVHGHDGTECVFKVLHGKLEEVRFTPDSSAKFLSSASYRPGSIAYINDYMAYHQVGNPYGTSAISLHVYLK